MDAPDYIIPETFEPDNEDEEDEEEDEEGMWPWPAFRIFMTSQTFKKNLLIIGIAYIL